MGNQFKNALCIFEEQTENLYANFEIVMRTQIDNCSFIYDNIIS